MLNNVFWERNGNCKLFSFSWNYFAVPPTLCLVCWIIKNNVLFSQSWRKFKTIFSRPIYSVDIAILSLSLFIVQDGYQQTFHKTFINGIRLQMYLYYKRMKIIWHYFRVSRGPVSDQGGSWWVPPSVTPPAWSILFQLLASFTAQCP